MKRFFLFSFVCCIFLLIAASCGRPDHLGIPLPTDQPILTVTQAIEPSRLGKSVLVRGEVNEVCQDEGCWMTITDSTNGLRVTFAGSAFVAPMDLQGTVVAAGTVSEEVFDEADAKLMAETMGWEQSAIEAIHGDTRLPVLTAVGVQFEGH